MYPDLRTNPLSLCVRLCEVHTARLLLIVAMVKAYPAT